MTLGQKITQLRAEHGITQKELALKLNTSTGTIAEWESDETAPTAEDTLRLCEVFDISPNYLRDDPDETIVEDEIEVKPETIESSGKASEEIHVEQEQKTQPDAETGDAPKRFSKSRKVVLFSALAVVLLAGIVLLLVLFVFNKPFSKDSDAIAEAEASVVMIYCYDYEGNLSATGSGFIAYDDKTVVTNYHVIEEGYTCKVSTYQDVQYNVQFVTRYSQEMDIAILTLEQNTGLTPLSFGESNKLDKGDNVVAIGSPLGIKNTVSTGVLSAHVKEGSNEILQFTAAISPGSSGGALFDDEGKVIGITYASYYEGQNLNLAIPIESVEEVENTKMRKMLVHEPNVEKYPYISYLRSHNTVDTTLDSIKKNPQKFDGKLVRFTAYISSYEQVEYSGYQYFEVYLSNEKRISTYDNDANIFINTYPSLYGNDPIEYPLLRAIVSCNNVDIPFGDQVCCVGEIYYNEYYGRYYLSFIYCDVMYSLDSYSFVIREH